MLQTVKYTTLYIAIKVKRKHVQKQYSTKYKKVKENVKKLES